MKKIFAAETGNYFLVLGATLFLVVFGLIMVLSSSAVESLTATGGSFGGFLRQGSFALVGIPLMLFAARRSAVFWKKWAGIIMIAAIGLQLLVFMPGIGFAVGGNRNWIHIGSFTAQPSELIKVALVVWISLTLAKKRDSFDNWRELIVPLVPVAGAAIGLVLLGGDLGTVIILAAIVFGALFFAGIKLRFLAAPVIVLGFLGLIAAFATGSRQDRIGQFLNGCKSDAAQACWQTVHGWWALASGGFFGVGLGNSKLKWSWIPEADNDFIFAVIGEELGLLGAILVLALFIVLAIGFVRIIRANRDPFAKVAVSAVMVWIIGQAFINIAVVLGILPVLGVPLPLISAGGSSLVTTLIAIGIVLSFARYAPERQTAPAVAVGARRPSDSRPSGRRPSGQQR
ncbi:putative lipid II flippase FtsW [Lacisediminihabitans changchengi]|uniref:putative lipid II flippase FtsW n=1 Tax=Lacisediminihabitans changchengi TaxID=2787634 RepID=UPI0027DE8A87|nr:putative lipid II flippase FtsW [Lacisediminihabitans changchengi]